jgi:hypothetical protein
MAKHRMGWGQVVFPNEGNTPQEFNLNGNPTRFDEAKSNRGYGGQFMIIACVAYGSTLTEERFRTAKAFFLFKASGTGKIDLNGETVAQSELRLQSAPGGSFAK